MNKQNKKHNEAVLLEADENFKLIRVTRHRPQRFFFGNIRREKNWKKINDNWQT